MGHRKGQCIKRIAELLQEGLSALDAFKVESLGVSLSGLETDEIKKYIEDGLMKTRLCSHVYACSDTVCPIATATDKGGFIAISGTGSNCRLVNNNGSSYTCGGWGHLIGDRGSATAIAMDAIKYVFEARDNREPYLKYSTDHVLEKMLEYFAIEKLDDMLDHLYTNYDKTRLAGFTKHIAFGAKDGDELCQYLMNVAGYDIAEPILTLASKVHDDLKSGPITVVCTGSVFLSWQYLKPGFLRCFMEPDNQVYPNGLRLVVLNRSAALGAAALGAKSSGASLKVDYDKYVKELDLITI